MNQSITLDALDGLLRTDSLYSHFQPIIDLQTGRSHGHEALIRTPADCALSTPVALYDAANLAGRVAELDLHCCRTHLRNYTAAGERNRLFLNLNPIALLTGTIDCDAVLACVEKAGLWPHQVVIEITEHMPVSDYASLRSTLDDLRQAGIEIAIDDLGSGYSGLRQWSELHPQYVKIDAHFIRDVHNCNTNRQFIHSIVEIARALGSRVIAEGIETQQELDAVIALGVHYGQGYLLGRPTTPPQAVEMQDWHITERHQTSRTTQTVSTILKYTPSITPETTVSEVMQRFDRRPGLRCLVVCEGRQPQGLVTRAHLTSVFASLYGRDLFSRRPVSSIMQTELICVTAHTQLDALSERLTREYDYLPEQDLVITDGDGSFMGTASFTDLLHAITELQIRSARYANPLTQLPGSVPINERIDQLLLDGENFYVAYCDLDNFKPYNDVYGYVRGDDVLRQLAKILEQQAGPDDLVGHIGGDDYILVLRSDDWEDRCKRMLEHFSQLAPSFYDKQHREVGGIQAENRRGEHHFHAFLSVSIGVTHAEPYAHGSHMEISAAAAEVKQQAKKALGNSLFLDRRGYAAIELELPFAQAPLRSAQITT